MDRTTQRTLNPIDMLAVTRTTYPNGTSISYKHGMPKPVLKCLRSEMIEAVKQVLNLKP